MTERSALRGGPQRHSLLRMTRREIGLVALLLGIVWFAIHSTQRHSAAWAEWEETRDSVLAQAEVEAQAAADATLRADSAEARAAAAQAVADELATRTRERVVEVRRVEVPVAAQPFVAPRDSIIDDLSEENDSLRVANSALHEANNELRAALWGTQRSVAELRGVIDLVPGPKAWWKPELGAGMFVGLCTGNEVCAGTGLTLTWRIPWG